MAIPAQRSNLLSGFRWFVGNPFGNLSEKTGQTALYSADITPYLSWEYATDQDGVDTLDATADLAVRALRSAVARRQPRGTVVVHSDRGGQFRSRKFRAVLKANDLTGSMGRVSSAGDNAAMESFYSLLQKNVLNRRRWRTRDELAYAIIFWIEHTYNRRRRQRNLGKLTPVEFELAFTHPAADAA